MLIPIEVVEPYLSLAPADIEGVARGLNISIRDAVLPLDDAVHLEMREGRWHAFLNRVLTPRQRRFAIAHCVSHYILHRDLVEPLMADCRIHKESFRYRSHLDESVERQASRFAVTLLVSRKIAKTLAREPDDERMAASLANHFEIPMPIARLCVIDYGLSMSARLKSVVEDRPSVDR